jgi:hypothetical protein
VTITYYVGATYKGSWTATVACSGTFSKTIPTGSLLGSGKVTADDGGGRSASKTFTIVL